MKQSLTIVFWGLSLCLAGSYSIAQETKKEDLEINCSQPFVEIEHFRELQVESIKLGEILCKSFKYSMVGEPVDEPAIRLDLGKFSSKSKKSLDRFGVHLKPTVEGMNYEGQFNEIDELFSNFTLRNPKLPEFSVSTGSTSAEDQRPYGEFSSIANGRFYFNDVRPCSEYAQSISCIELLREFQVAFNPYRAPHVAMFDNQKKLDELGVRWNKFLEVSKSQTAFEVLLTTYANQKHFKKDHLVGPPPFQIIALHPNMVYNSLDKAADGNQLELGLGVEWIGVNFWDWKVPFGASFASVYIDRAEVKDVGHGLQLHFYNQYSIGWAKHDHDDSFYVTIDLLKLFGEKSEMLDKYLK